MQRALKLIKKHSVRSLTTDEVNCKNETIQLGSEHNVQG